MSWIYLCLAGVLEVGWAIGLKYSNGFSRLWPSLITLVLMVASFAFLSMAMRHLPVGTAYAVWTGIGALGAALLGMILFAEPVTLLRLGSLALILAGVTGLKLAT